MWRAATGVGNENRKWRADAGNGQRMRAPEMEKEDGENGENGDVGRAT